MRQITVKEVEFVAHRMAKELLAFSEPIPDFGSRYPLSFGGLFGRPLSYLWGSFAVFIFGFQGRRSLLPDD